tara:strand:+ start:401 stop:592 length:192 start_codon:yes stop_codon:yes gene_type:complete
MINNNKKFINDKAKKCKESFLICLGMRDFYNTSNCINYFNKCMEQDSNRKIKLLPKQLKTKNN